MVERLEHGDLGELLDRDLPIEPLAYRWREVESHGIHSVLEDTANSVLVGQGQDFFPAADTGAEEPEAIEVRRKVDLDSDGWLDIFYVSGHVYPQVDGADLGTSYRQRSQLFRNLGLAERGQVRFEEILPKAGDPLAVEKVNRGLSLADCDNDGDLDLFIVALDDKPTLLSNETQARHWIGFERIGGQKNRDAIGARVEVHLRDQNVPLLKTLRAGEGFLSQCSKWLHFGLGAGQVERVVVRWPGGKPQTFTGLEAGRFYRLVQGREQGERWTPPTAPELQAAPLPLEPPSEPRRSACRH